jgi:hypothetical protein
VIAAAIEPSSNAAGNRVRSSAQTRTSDAIMSAPHCRPAGLWRRLNGDICPQEPEKETAIMSITWAIFGKICRIVLSCASAVMLVVASLAMISS